MIWLTLLLAANGPNPAYVPPNPLWGELKPSDTVTIAATRDHSAFDDSTQQFPAARFSVAVEPWNGVLLEANNTGLAIWDIAANAKNPMRTGSFTSNAIPKIPTGENAKSFVTALAAPPGLSAVAVLAQDFGGGTLLINVTDKAAPVVLYQDGDPTGAPAKSCRGAYTAVIGAKPYAFVACDNAVNIYDLAAAAMIAAPYQEVAPNAASAHPAVFVAGGKLSSTWVDAGATKTKKVTHLHGVDQFIVTNASEGGGFDVWDVSSVSSPIRLGGGMASDYVGNVAMWKSNTRTYVAALSSTQLQIFDVTPVVKGTATAAGAAVFSTPAVRAYEANTRLHLSTAADGSPMLSYATGREPPHDPASVGLLEEFLYDVSDASTPRDITPQVTLVNGVQTNYWGYGYQFGWARAQGGRFSGAFFYRAAFGVLEIHQWTPPLNRPPVITSTPVALATVNRAYSYQVTATDPENKALTFTKVSGPDGLDFLTLGEVSWVPSATDVGSHPVAVSVSDGKNIVPHSWTITVSLPGVDAGTKDGGTGSDGGTNPTKPGGGCGCSTTAAAPFALLALLRLATRRRASRLSE